VTSIESVDHLYCLPRKLYNVGDAMMMKRRI